MNIGGFQKFSLIEYPGKIAAIIFTQGCNFRCPYCYNPELVIPNLFGSFINHSEILSFLKNRKDNLDGVVITGGEPTIHKNLPQFLGLIKQLGYSIKINTNGSNPEMIAKLLEEKLVDFICMDLKAPFEKYSVAAGVNADLAKISQSIELLKNSKINFEFRTTFDKGILSENDISIMRKIVGEKNRYIIQGSITPSNKTLLKDYLYNCV